MCHPPFPQIPFISPLHRLQIFSLLRSQLQELSVDARSHRRVNLYRNISTVKK